MHKMSVNGCAGWSPDRLRVSQKLHPMVEARSRGAHNDCLPGVEKDMLALTFSRLYVYQSFCLLIMQCDPACYYGGVATGANDAIKASLPVRSLRAWLIALTTTSG